MNSAKLWKRIIEKAQNQAYEIRSVPKTKGNHYGFESVQKEMW
ncbi:hypothetical protein [Paenibacillus odorifer]|nr:hypothetical protein [Paenibacillus odorifer]